MSHYKRKNYHSLEGNSGNASFGYCKKKGHWMLFKDVGESDPCEISRKNELAHSAKTQSFDISSSFDDSWYSASGAPLELYFFDTEDNGLDLVDSCGSFLNNGKCENAFNTFGYQYDGGDCCASTCSKPNCGDGGIKNAFGQYDIVGIGYPNCTDPVMVPITIHLHEIWSSRNKDFLNDVSDDDVNEYYREKGIDFWEEPPHTPLFNVDCKGIYVMSIYLDKPMENHTETVMVEDGSMCSVSASNRTNLEPRWDDDPIWWVKYSVYHGRDTSIEIIRGNSAMEQSIDFHRIKDCYFGKLEGSINISEAYGMSDPAMQAFHWLLDDESGHSYCDDNFLIERFALCALNFAAPIKSASNHPDESLWINEKHQCRWDNIACDEGAVETLAVRRKSLIGTIHPSVGLLTGLERLDYDGNQLTGTIPSELAKLTNLKGLDLDNNNLTGTIPTEFGFLVNLVELDLDSNKLTGSIPTEFCLMLKAREFDLKFNQLSGPIPSEIRELKGITTFFFEGNILSGSIPTEIGFLSNMQELHLSENKITGPIPGEIQYAENMSTLWFDFNNMTGTIPTEISKLKKLKQLKLDNNNFTGPIPTEIGLMTFLEEIRLDHNSFTGPIPSEIGKLTKLSLLRLGTHPRSGRYYLVETQCQYFANPVSMFRIRFSPMPLCRLFICPGIVVFFCTIYRK